MRTALDVVSGQAVMDIAEADGGTRTAQIKIVIVTGVSQAAVVVHSARLDPLTHACRRTPVAVGHDTHVVMVDIASADRHMIGLIDSHSGAVVMAVVCLEQLKPFQHAVIATRVELEDGARRPTATVVVKTCPGDLDPSSIGIRNGPKSQISLPHEHGSLLVRLAIVAGINQDEITRLGGVVGLLDARKRPSRPHLERPASGDRVNDPEPHTKQQKWHLARPNSHHAHTMSVDSLSGIIFLYFTRTSRNKR